MSEAERLASVPASSAAVSLRSVIDTARRLDELSIARLIELAAERVHKAQAQGQPLGRLAPEAILVTATGEVMIQLPATASVAHSAPERLRGADGDRRSDVFSLGALLWEALARTQLFDGPTEAAIRSAVQTDEVLAVNELNANVPHELAAICKKALARDPADRYQSARVMAAEISAVLDDAGYPEDNAPLAQFIADEFPAAPAAPVVAAPAPRTPTSPATPTVSAFAVRGDDHAARNRDPLRSEDRGACPSRPTIRCRRR